MGLLLYLNPSVTKEADVPETLGWWLSGSWEGPDPRPQRAHRRQFRHQGRHLVVFVNSDLGVYWKRAWLLALLLPSAMGRPALGSAVFRP